MKKSGFYPSKMLKILVFFNILVLLSGCGADSSLSSSSLPSSSGHSAAVTSAVYTDFYDGAVSSHDSEFLYYKPVVSLEEAYPGYKLTKINIEDTGKNAFAKYITANGDIYLGLTDFYLPDRGVFDEIGYYSLSQNKFISLVLPQENYDISFSGGALDRYLIWEIVSRNSTYRMSINLLDTQTGSNREIFDFGETNFYASRQMVCIDGTVYFSSALSDPDGKWIGNRLYSYDISGGKLDVAAQEGSCPFSFGGKLAYLVSASEENGTSISFTAKTADETVIYRQNPGYEAFVKGGGSILALSDMFYLPEMIRLKEKKGMDVSDDKASMTGTDADRFSRGQHCLYTVQNGKVDPIAVSLSENLEIVTSCDGRFVCLSGTNKTPFFYDAKLDQIVRMEGVKNGSAFSMISGENHLLLKVETYDPATFAIDFTYYLLEKPT